MCIRDRYVYKEEIVIEDHIKDILAGKSQQDIINEIRAKEKEDYFSFFFLLKTLLLKFLSQFRGNFEWIAQILIPRGV